MKRSLVLMGCLLSSAALAAGETTEVLVGTTPTQMPTTTLNSRRSLEIQNLGSDPLYCGFSVAKAVSSKARRVNSGETWALSGTLFTVYCVTANAQSTGAATIVSELQ